MGQPGRAPCGHTGYLRMGSFTLACVGLTGAYAFVAIYALILWARDRQSVLPLASAIHAALAAGFALALLRVAHATSPVAMQAAVTLRMFSGLALLIATAALLSVFAGLRATPLVRGLGLVAMAVLATRLSGGGWARDVVGVEPVQVLGELVSSPVRIGGPTYGAMVVLVVGAALFSVYCAHRVWRTDRLAAGILLAASVVVLVVTPLVSGLRPLDMQGQLLLLLLQVSFVFLGVLLIAREHEARAEVAVSAERLYRAMFDQTYQFVGLLDLDGRVIDVNQTALDAVAAPLSAVYGMRFEDTPWWVGSPDAGRVRQAIEAAAAGATQRFEFTYMAGRSPRLLDFSIRPLRDERGAVFMLIPEARDITDEREAREAHRRIDEQLQQAQKLEAVGQLAGGIAHDFNNLLTVIHGFANLLATTPEAARRQMELEQIQAASERAMSLTRQLLTFSHHAVSDEQYLDVNALVRRADPLLRRLIGPDITLRLTCGDGLLPVKADPDQLERVLINLAVNARDAMPRGGQLELVTRVPDAQRDHVTLPDAPGWTVLDVIDTGDGMTPDVQARLFEPFFTTKAPGKGTGLGLAVVDRVVTQAQGVVSVSSVLGRGTCFTIYLPGVLEVAPHQESTAALEAPSGGTETILVVDDEVPVRELAAAALTQHGYAVLQAGTPPEALAVARAHVGPIDLLLTDVVMPGGSALAIVEGLTSTHPDLRVLFMSGYPADEAVRRGVAAGEANFLQKPFTPAVLAARVRHLLDAEASTS